MGECAPAFGACKGSAEIFGCYFGCECKIAFGAVILVSSKGCVDTPTGECPCVVVATLDFVVWIVFGRVVALLDAVADGEGLVEHIFPDHVAGDLVLDARPYLVFVANTFCDVWGLGPSAGEQARLTGSCKPAFGFVVDIVGANVGRPVVFPDRLQRLVDVFGRIDVAEADVVCPTLAKELVGQAPLFILKFGMLFQVDARG